MIAPIDKVPKEFQLSEGNLIGDFPNLLSRKKTLSTVKCIKGGIVYLLNQKNIKEFLL